MLVKGTSLEEHLMWQLTMASLTDEEMKFGELVVGNLNEEGYLTANVPDLALEAGLDPEDAEEVLKMIHAFDPVGIGSRSAQECLLIQARLLEPRRPLVEEIIEHHLSELERRNYPVMAKSLQVPVEDVVAATRLIQEFEPHPGRAFQSTESNYISPDIYIHKIKGEFVISLNDEGIPRLRISSYYRNLLSSPQGKEILAGRSTSLDIPAAAGAADGGTPAEGGAATPTAAGPQDTKRYVEEKLRSALWLIRSIHNRQKTIFKVTEAILKRQKEFFENGVQFLKPMVLKDIASDVGMHESTISRVTTNKYVHTPLGIFELKYFFNSSISASDGGESHASEAVKDRIKQMVSKEDERNPLSDEKIAEFLKKDGIDIARRTVAKYREQLNILSSSKRKRFF
jgi:RNA polymerase sigma-54 factor